MIPELRFPEFEGDWVEKRLEKLFSEFKSGQNITATQIKDNGKYPVYGGNGLRGYFDDFTHNGNFFLIGRQGALCGNINRSVGKAFFSEHAIACKANDENDTEWFAQRLDYYNLNRLSESSAQPGLSVSKLLRFKLAIPTKPEQTKIANFLAIVDKRINLLQKKKAELTQYKKGVMQKLFSQEIRFEQEDDSNFPDWEEKTLGEIGEILNGLTYNPKDINDNGILVLRSSNVQNRILTFNDNVFVEAQTFNPVKENDILICVRNGSKKLIGKNAIINKENEGIAFGAFMAIYRSEYNRYLFHWFDTDEYKKEVNKNLGATINSINGSHLRKFRIPFPSIDEQKKIANFLSSIDKAIENIANQIEQSQKWKKGLLQRMFV